MTQPSDGRVQAFSAICTHQGCLVDLGRRRRDPLPVPRQRVLHLRRRGADRAGAAALPQAKVTVSGTDLILGA